MKAISYYLLTITFLCLIISCEEQVRPNILFIMVDDLRPELACYGKAQIHSPNIDALSNRGVLFQNAYCQISWCAPSRTSILTGLRPDKTKCYDLVTHFRSNLPNTVTLPQYFKQNGYHTRSFGKVFHSEEMDDSLSWSEPSWFPPVDRIGKSYFSTENINIAESRKNGFAAAYEYLDVADSIYPDGMTTQAVIKAVKGANEKPFFYSAGFYKPHMPFIAPRKYWNLYNRDSISITANLSRPSNSPPYLFRSFLEPSIYTDIPIELPYPDSLAKKLIHGYYACISYIDNQVGLIVEALEEEGLLDNTIIVLWGDHGWKLADYGYWSKHSNLEIDTRVPLIIYDPRGRSGEITDAVVESIDVYPTLCELAGLPVPVGPQGTSLKSLVKEGIPGEKDFAISQIVREDTLMGYSIRTSEYRMVRWESFKSPSDVHSYELYNHLSDPEETKNVALDPGYKNLIIRLETQLDERVDRYARLDAK